MKKAKKSWPQKAAEHSTYIVVNIKTHKFLKGKSYWSVQMIRQDGDTWEFEKHESQSAALTSGRSLADFLGFNLYLDGKRLPQ